jgi:hypothetical protein
MNRLSQEQQQLILDFYFRCGEQDDIEQGRDLIAPILCGTALRRSGGNPYGTGQRKV